MSAPAATLAQALEAAARAEGDPGVRVLDRRERAQHRTWRQIARGSAAVAAGLVERGLCRQQPVGLVFGTGFDFVHAFFGILAAGGVPVPVAPPLRLARRDDTIERLEHTLGCAGARWALVETGLRPLLGASSRFFTLGELAPQARGAVAGGPAASASEDGAALGLIQFSSGTTGDPKPVALSHHAVLVQARLLGDRLCDRPGVVQSGVSWLPLYHDMGLIGGLLVALCRGADLTLMAPEVFLAQPALWLRAISRYRATVSPAPTFAYDLCTRRVQDRELAGVDLSCWRAALCGAEVVSGSVLRGFAARFAPFGFRPEALTPVYGLAEAALAVTFSDQAAPFRSVRCARGALGRGRFVADPAGTEIVAVGAPVDGFEVEIRSERGRRLPPRRVGRVFARGPSLMAGYLGQPEATARALAGGWLDTGDLGFLDQGELYLTGRAKDVLIVRGRNHAPEALEDAAAQVPGVRALSVVAVSHRDEHDASERVLLFAECERGQEQDAEALARSCRERVLAATGVAVSELWVLEPGRLPRTSSGKLRRRETLRRYLAGALSALPAEPRPAAAEPP